MSEVHKAGHNIKDTLHTSAGNNQSNKANSGVHRAKREALEKLNVAFSELNDSFSRTKSSFQVYKTKSFFFPHPEFCKPFAESLKLVENELQEMGNIFRKEVGDKFTHGTSTDPVPAVSQRDYHESASDRTPEHAEASLKNNETSSITPPASEVDNDEEVLARVLDQPERDAEHYSLDKRKRKHRKFSDTLTPKKPRRSLIDDYLTKTNDEKNLSKSDDKEEDEEEEEFEVQRILDLKRTQGQLLYYVSWKGYGPQDNTWEPPSNLTGCEELLLEFYRIKLRDQDKSSSEEMSQIIHYDHSNKETICKAVFDHLGQPSKDDHQNIVALVVSPKSPPLKSQKEVDELIEKTFLTRKRHRYLANMKILLEDKLTKELKPKREVQLAELRKWERSINSICSDPAKLCVENNVDLELPPMDFTYINECYAGEGVTIPSDPLVGCECEDCSTAKSCCPTPMSSWIAYNKYGRLKVSLGTPIYECNKRCKCSPGCVNRVVQNGRKISLCIFRTSNGRGWGVKAMENIKKDSLVTEYVGEVISSEEAERRGKIYDAQRCTYLFDLDYNKGDQNPYTVDAAKCGNVSHFVNHSCDPNLVVFNVWVNCLDPDLPRLALFATRDIKKGEELTFDYNSGLESEQKAASTLQKEANREVLITPEKGRETKDLLPEIFLKTPKGNRGLQYGKTKCRCGAANCRKYFF